MKRVYAKKTEESGYSILGMLAAFLFGVLAAMSLHWLLHH
jgi:hypothetical protein